MKKLLLIVSLFLVSVGIFVFLMIFFTKDDGKGALQVTAEPKSTVFLNGKELGKTPLCSKCDVPPKLLPVGQYTLRLLPEDSTLLPYEETITIIKSVLTVVDRTFGKGANSEGSIITLTPIGAKNAAQLWVASLPSDADVYLDSSSKGKTPLLLKGITESDHEIKIQKNGYKDKVIRVKAKKGYKLDTKIILGISNIVIQPIISIPSDLVVLSATISATDEKNQGSVTILQTPTGFLRVREAGSVTALEIDRVKPKEIYPLIGQANDWYLIELKNGKKGWISSQYAQKDN